VSLSQFVFFHPVRFFQIFLQVSFSFLLTETLWSFPVPFDSGVSYSTVRYVSPSGNDQTGTGTQNAPFATLQRALQNHTPGLRIILLPGTYPSGPGPFPDVRGTAQQPIKVEGQGNVVFNATNGTAVEFRDPQYLVIENITIQNSPVHGMNIDDGGTYDTPAQHVIIRNVRFNNIGTGGNQDCLKLSGVDHFWIEGSEFVDCDFGEAIDMVGCHEGLVTGNYFHDMPGTAVQAKGGSRNVVIHGNRFRNVANHSINLGGSTGDPYVRPTTAPYEGERIQAIGNTIENAGRGPIFYQGCNECLVANNTLVNPASYLVGIVEGRRDTSTTRARNGYFINNIVYYNSTAISSTLNVGGNTDPQTFTFANNLYYATNGIAFNGVHGSGVPNEVNSLLQYNPQFVNVAQSDFHVNPASPVLRRGRALPFGTLYYFDRSDATAPFDLGAYPVVGNPPSGSRCDINVSGSTDVSDVQLCANQAIGTVSCSSADINQDGQCSVVDVQRVVNAALGGACVSP
jgi:hypothetical protein